MSWQSILRTNFIRLADLATFLQLPHSVVEKLSSSPNFPINVPRRIADKMQKGSIEDPLFRQFVPLKKEEKRVAGFLQDPVDDLSFRKSGALLQKYQARALLVTTGACAMNCRFCFRQNYPYNEQDASSSLEFTKELDYLAKTPLIEEVILSGGDPLSLSNRVLGSLIKSIEAFSHVQRIRFHTRFLIGIPERVDEGLCTLVSGCQKQVILVLHINHVKELDQDIIASLKVLQRLGVTLLSQTVLLRGVNDSLQALEGLMKALGNVGVIPYYLHQLDRIQGGQHFEVSKEEGCRLIEELQKVLPGYLVPRYVQEISGMSNKTPLVTV